MASAPIFTKTGAAGSPWQPTKGQFFPYADPKRRDQVFGIAEGQHSKVMDLGVTVQLFHLTWKRMSKSDRDNLIGFLEDALVNYQQFTFTYTDQDSTTHTVRFIGTEVNYAEVGPDLHDVDIVLREEV